MFLFAAGRSRESERSDLQKYCKKRNFSSGRGQKRGRGRQGKGACRGKGEDGLRGRTASLLRAAVRRTPAGFCGTVRRRRRDGHFERSDARWPFCRRRRTARACRAKALFGPKPAERTHVCKNCGPPRAEASARRWLCHRTNRLSPSPYSSLASPKILPLGKRQASLLLPSLIRIFVSSKRTDKRWNPRYSKA